MLSPDQIWDKWKPYLIGCEAHGLRRLEFNTDSSWKSDKINKAGALLKDEFLMDLEAYGEWRDFMQAKAEVEANEQ